MVPLFLACCLQVVEATGVLPPAPLPLRVCEHWHLFVPVHRVLRKIRGLSWWNGAFGGYETSEGPGIV